MLINKKPGSISDFIRAGEKIGIHFLFNQASSGRVSGITYFFKDFKAKGQALGNQFKWAELTRKVNYTASDNIPIREANKRTLEIYGVLLNVPSAQNNSEEFVRNPFEIPDGQEFNKKQVNTIETEIDVVVNADSFTINITDDVDDEAIHGKLRHRRQAR
jgi:hypothetical protein